MNVTISEELLLEAVSGLKAYGGVATEETRKKLVKAWAQEALEMYDREHPVTLFVNDDDRLLVDPHDDPMGGY